MAKVKTIEIDHRENTDQLVSLLENTFGFQVSIKQLRFGDYLIPPDTVIERKTTRDFLVSILDGRLFQQAYRLAELAERPIIIIEGNSFTDRNEIGISLAAIKGAFISLAQTFHLPVLRTQNEADTAWHINQLFEQRQRIGVNRGSLHAYSTKRLEIQKSRVLRAIPGIGPKMAKCLLEKFGSVSNVIKASTKDLLKVPGVGKKTVDKIQHVIKENIAEYKL